MVLARETATVDLLTDGRLELGLGAGYVRSEYDQAGLRFDRGSVRVERLGAVRREGGRLRNFIRRRVLDAADGGVAERFHRHGDVRVRGRRGGGHQGLDADPRRGTGERSLAAISI